MSKRPQVMLVLGTRPEAIKLAPVARALERAGDLNARVCITAQHRRMLDQTLSSFGLSPHHDLDLMRPGQTLNAFSARALAALGELFAKAKPDMVLVQGDTTTAMIGALAAFHERIPVGHVEAGLRTFDRDDPFPEELNRVLIDELSVLHFPPTPAAACNVSGPPASIVVAGNTVVDALKWAASHPRPAKAPELKKALAKVQRGDTIILATTHRRESFGKTMAGFCRAFQRLVEAHPDAHLFYPVHLNPSVQSAVRSIVDHPRAHLLPPLDYFDLVLLLKRCRFVMTDSGGLQEEAPSLGKPVLVLRKVTERMEAVDAGLARLAGVDAQGILALATRLLRDEAFYSSMSRKADVFGDGRASERIAQAVRRYFGLTGAHPRDFAPPALRRSVRA